MTEQTLYLIRNKFTAEGWKTVKRTYDAQKMEISQIEKQTQRYGKNYIKQTKTTAKGNIILSESYGEVSKKTGSMVRALKRAAVVAPIWLALRTVLMSVVQTVKEGAKYWMEFDKAMQKTQQVIHGVTGNMSEAVEILTSKIRKLSIETGQSMAKLSAAFYRFGTVGLNFETSMKGMFAATKLATVMFGDNEKIAKVLAQTYRLLGNSMDSSIPVTKRMEVIGSQIYKLWKTNAFEIDEFTGALERFLPTANMFNFEITDSLALLASLHTAGVKGTRAGRLLGSSLQKLVSNMGSVAQTLGVEVNPNLDTTFEMLMKTLGAVKKLKEAGRKIPDIENLTVFGGVRQRRAPMALIALYDTLLKNIKTINIENGKYSVLLDDINEKYGDILDSVHKQAERFGNLRKMAGQAFVKGIVGADSFKLSLKEINERVEKKLIPSLEKIGDILHRYGGLLAGGLGLKLLIAQPVIASILAAGMGLHNLNSILLQGEKSQKEYWKRMEEGKLTLEELYYAQLKLNKITATGEYGFKKGTTLFKTTKEFDEYRKKLKEMGKVIGFSMREGVEGAKDLQDAIDASGVSIGNIVNKIKEWQSQGLVPSDIIKNINLQKREIKKFQEFVENIRKEIKEGRLEEGIVQLVEPKTGKKLFVYMDKLTEKTKDGLKTQIIIRGTIQEQLNLLEQEVNYMELLNQGYLESEIAMKKLTGYISEQVRIYNATQGVKEGTVKAIKTESVLSAVLSKNYKKVLDIFNQSGIQQEKLVELERKRLDIVKARIKEEAKTPKISSETLKLYRIAQKYGAEPARRIAEFLRGKIDYQAFQYRESFDIFKKEFSQMEEKFRAAEYLKRGVGRGIPIKEEAIRVPDIVRKYRMRKPDERIQIPDVPVVSPKINFKTVIEKIEVKLPEGAQEDLAESIGKDVIESIKRNEEIAKLLAKTIRPYI